MGKVKTRIRLAEEPYRIIKWFTNNWSKEIGAVGVCKIVDGELYVEKLCFPDQTVNGAHVHFKPADWGPIVTQLEDHEIAKVLFYWHKHPDNNPGASPGDEEDTFDAFMDEKSGGRRIFGFLQTSAKTGNDFIYEARLELRKPIKATIKDVELISDSDVSVEKICKRIIMERVKEGTLGASDQPGINAHKTKEEDATTTITPVNDDAYMEVSKTNGSVLLKFNTYFEQWIREMVDGADVREMIFNSVIDYTKEKDGEIQIKLFPKKKRINELLDYFEILKEQCFPKTQPSQIDDTVSDFESVQTQNDDQLREIMRYYA